MKRFPLLVLALFFTVSVTAQSETDGAGDTARPFYVSVNPCAALMRLTTYTGIGSVFTYVLTGGEDGLALEAGYFPVSSLALATRVSAGAPTDANFLYQIHLGANFFFLDRFDDPGRGPYVGLFLKYDQSYYALHRVSYFNLIPYLSFGYGFGRGRWIVDLRLVQTIAAFSFSSMEHTRPGIAWYFSPIPALSPVLPSLFVSVGYRF